MLTVTRSLVVWTAVILLIIGFLPLVAVVRLFDRDPARYYTGRLFRFLGKMMTKVNPMWRIDVRGAEKITDPRRPYVVVSNHQSLADIPIISNLPWEMKWVSKASMFKLPVAGWMMRLAGDIPVNRADRDSRAAVHDTALSVLRRRCSVMFFAEGTRTKDERVLPFRDGAFRLAIAAQVPVLPLVVDGSRDCLPKHSWLLRRISRVHLAVLPPVETEGLGEGDTAALRDRVRGMIMDQIAEWRGVSREAVDALAATPAA
ncbi:MAG: 1-acyl-sn-glycerol-3-phosphate acyltransferase [Deltaproteobacteria bacterium]|nr:1-acyl-sn-glycerol-3-phosphate acyltransferase [Deltaproteobacteria bacterium]